MFFQLFARALGKYRDLRAREAVVIGESSLTQGRALILHKTEPLLPPKTRRYDKHSNSYELLNMVAEFVLRGFEVTVVDRTCRTEHLPTESYDVVIGLADSDSGVHLPRLWSASPDALKIAYCAGSEPSARNVAIAKRYEHAYSRSPLQRPPQMARQTTQLNFGDVSQIADAFVVVGNHTTGNTYQKAARGRPVFLVDGIAMNTRTPRRDGFSPRGFLAVSGNGGISKGIDLVYDAARTLRDSKFAVCSPRDPELTALVASQGPLPQNLTNFGFVYAGSRRFERICSSHRFAILPSASEGMATSVLTAMTMGLIPICTAECGVDTPPNCFELQLNSDLAPVLDHAEGLSTNDLQDLSDEVLRFSRRFSAENHRRMFSNALAALGL